jgi:hypothetical protein
MTDVRTVYAKARAETAKLLGYGDDIDGLTAAQSTRLDVASALRIVIDDQAAKLLRGESADVGKLLSTSEALAKILPPAVLATPPPDASHHQDPRQVMFKIYMEMRERGEVPPEGWYQHRINGLEAEVAALKAQLVGAGLTPALPDMAMQKGNRRDRGDLPIDPTEVVPPSEYLGVLPMRGPDDPKPQSTTVIEAKANSPPAASAPAKPSRPAWEDWLDAGAGVGPGYDRWADNR